MSAYRAGFRSIFAIAVGILLLLPAVGFALVQGIESPEIPSIEYDLPYSSMSTLAADDATNVINFHLTKGKKLLAVISTPLDTHFEMRLYPPDTPSGPPPTDWHLVKSSAVDGDITRQFLSYKVQNSGT
jgi:hypothetical protein